MSDHLDDVQLSRLLDGDLSLTSREAVIDHLRTCPGCAARHDRLVAVTAALRMEPAMTWTGSDTEATLNRLPRRRRGKVAAAGAVSAAMCVLVLVETAPLIAVPLALLIAVLGTGRALVDPAIGPGVELVVAVAAIAMLAPLAAYPLARWR